MEAAAASAVARQKPSRWAWVAYSLPALIVWSYYFWVFWPGVMPPDAFDQWNQLVTGRYHDWHPVFHTLCMRVVTWGWMSPAAIVAVQIAALSALVGLSVAYMQRAGMRRWLAWSICILVGVLPANATSAVTVVKDSAYGIAFVWLVYLLFRSAESGGEWLGRRGNWAALGAAAALVALFRHNGFPVAFGSLCVLLLVARAYWRQLGLSLVLAAGCWGLVRGPLYRSLGVPPVPERLKLCMPLHYIAAHLNNGTTLTDQERKLLERVRPLDAGMWPYDPCNSGLLLFDRKLNLAVLDSEASSLYALFFKLLYRNPEATVRHLFSSSCMIWRISRPAGTRYVLASFAIDEKAAYRIDPNQRHLGPGKWTFPLLQVRNLPPGLLWATGDRVAWLLWRPALALYFFVFASVIAIVRDRSGRYVSVAVPVVLQSLVMMAVPIVTDFRYQWPVFLSSILFGPYLLLCVRRRASLTGPGTVRPTQDEVG